MELNIKLSAWQDDIYESFGRYRFTTISAGRQSGKSTLSLFILTLRAADMRNSVHWFCSPIYSSSIIAFDKLLSILVDNNIQFTKNRTNLTVTFTNGGKIQFKSCDDERSLRGESVDTLVLDECANIKRSAWDYALRGVISSTLAPVLVISTPKGKGNLFHEFFTRGQDSQEEDYYSIQIPSNKSRWFNEDWDKLRASLPARVFQQEYEAAFLSDEGAVFRNIRGCCRGALQGPGDRQQYFAGVDLAKTVDFSVICILNQDAHLVYFERFKDISWAIQQEKIKNAIGSYNAYTLIDSTGLGDPILESLQSSGLPISGYKFTNASKAQLVEKLILEMEQGRISYPEIDELINELNVFSFETLPSGALRYGAGSGYHDDCVIALSLALMAHGGGASMSWDTVKELIDFSGDRDCPIGSTNDSYDRPTCRADRHPSPWD